MIVYVACLRLRLFLWNFTQDVVAVFHQWRGFHHVGAPFLISPDFDELSRDDGLFSETEIDLAQGQGQVFKGHSGP